MNFFIYSSINDCYTLFLQLCNLINETLIYFEKIILSFISKIIFFHNYIILIFEIICLDDFAHHWLYAYTMATANINNWEWDIIDKIIVM